MQFIWMISNRRLPQDDDDIKNMLSGTFLNMIPFFGPIMMRAADGWNTSVTVLGPFESAAKAGGRISKALQAKEMTDKDLEFILSQIYEATAISTGLPLVATERARKALKSDVPMQVMLFGGEINDSK